MHARFTVIFACCGCSFVAIRGVPDPVPPLQEPLGCTMESSVPSLDATGAVVFAIPAVLGTVVGLTAQCPGTAGHEVYSNGCALGAGVALLGGLTSAAISAGYGISAWTGYARTAGCRREMEERTVANLLAGRLHAPWDPGISPGSLRFAAAQKLCEDRKRRLPSRTEASILSAELRSQGPARLIVWTRDFAAAGAATMVDEGTGRAFSVDLATGRAEPRALDEEFRAVCIAP